MINLDSITNEKNKENIKKWPYVPDHLYRILIIGSSGSGKINALFHLIKKQDAFTECLNNNILYKNIDDYNLLPPL